MLSACLAAARWVVHTFGMRYRRLGSRGPFVGTLQQKLIANLTLMDRHLPAIRALAGGDGA
jgi:hypothetical protein